MKLEKGQVWYHKDNPSRKLILVRELIDIEIRECETTGWWTHEDTYIRNHEFEDGIYIFFGWTKNTGPAPLSRIQLIMKDMS